MVCQALPCMYIIIEGVGLWRFVSGVNYNRQHGRRPSVNRMPAHSAEHGYPDADRATEGVATLDQDPGIEPTGCSAS